VRQGAPPGRRGDGKEEGQKLSGRIKNWESGGGGLPRRSPSHRRRDQTHGEKSKRVEHAVGECPVYHGAEKKSSCIVFKSNRGKI